MKTSAYNGIFRTLTDETKFFNRFEQLVEDFGIENIVVGLPAHWASDFEDYNGPLTIKFNTLTEILVVAQCAFITVREMTPIFEVAIKGNFRSTTAA
jgi:hypothetical protein